MNLEDTKKLINSVIENEFNHVQEAEEKKDTINNVELNTRDKNVIDIFDKLLEVAPGHKELLDDFEDAVSAYWSELCRYYFKKGVIAGATNLKFLEETKLMHFI